MWKVGLFSLVCALSAVQGMYEKVNAYSATAIAVAKRCRAVYSFAGFSNHVISSWDQMFTEIMQEQNAQTGICGSGCFVDVAGETHILQRNEEFHHSSDPCRRYTCKVKNVLPYIVFFLYDVATRLSV